MALLHKVGSRPFQDTGVGSKELVPGKRSGKKEDHNYLETQSIKNRGSSLAYTHKLIHSS